MTLEETVLAIASFLAAPRFVTALTTAIVGTGVFAFALRQMMGWGGLIATIATLVILAAASIVARRSSIEWRGLLPISLLVFLGWATISIFWSHYHWATLGGLAYLGAFTILGLYAALLRDTIQIVRAYGDVLRFTLAVSLAIEVLSGILIDTPIKFLLVLGKISEFGPIQGISGARNQLGIVAVIALITFATEYRTHLVSRTTSVFSLGGAALVLALTRSPLAIGTLLLVGVGATALYGLRRVRPDRQRSWQIALLAVTTVLGVVAWTSRSMIIAFFNVSGELTYRLNVWRTLWDLTALNPLQGWGWIGQWRDDIAPFPLFSAISARENTSASNAFLDVWFQLGLVGIAIFAAMVALTFVRSWLLASRQRSIVFAWPALALIALVTSALAESSMLTEFGWLTFVACCVKAAGELSWRTALRPE